MHAAIGAPPPLQSTSFAPTGAPALPIWAVKGASRLPPISEVKDSLKDEEQRELGRLLYVAMTRARDRLYITGFHKGDLPAGCWYETIKTALVSAIEEGVDFRGRTVWSYGSLTQPQSFPHSLKKTPGKAMHSWLAVPAPASQRCQFCYPPASQARVMAFTLAKPKVATATRQEQTGYWSMSFSKYCRSFRLRNARALQAPSPGLRWRTPSLRKGLCNRKRFRSPFQPSFR